MKKILRYYHLKLLATRIKKFGGNVCLILLMNGKHRSQVEQTRFVEQVVHAARVKEGHQKIIWKLIIPTLLWNGILIKMVPSNLLRLPHVVPKQFGGYVTRDISGRKVFGREPCTLRDALNVQSNNINPQL